jgi:hypothetical protein
MAGKAISHVQGKGSIAHNNREFHFKNVDPERTQNNIVYKSQSIDEAYRECFGEAQERFNEKQTRADRKIEGSYFEHMFSETPESQKAKSVLKASNKQKSFYEALVQVGDMQDSKVGTADGERVAKCLDEYMRGFQERNPNFHVFNAVLHMDEATPHLHIDYIPVGYYTRGMDTQNGLAKALEEMGYGKGKGAINEWRLSERKALEEICVAYGIEVKEPEKGRGYSLTPDEYKTQIEAEKAQFKSGIDELETKKEQLEKEIEPLAKMEVRAEQIKTKDENGKDIHKVSKSMFGNRETVTVPKEDYDKMMSQSKSYRVNRPKIQKLEADQEAVRKRESAADGRERELIKKAETLAVKEKQVDGMYQQQSNLNAVHEQLRQEHEALQKKHSDMVKQANEQIKKGNEAVTSLNAQISTLQGELTSVRQNLTEKLERAYEGFQSAIKGLNMLKYGFNDGTPNPYKADLTPQQGRLIDGITNKASDWAKQDGFPEVADTMKNSMGLSKSIEQAVKALEPKSRGLER